MLIRRVGVKGGFGHIQYHTHCRDIKSLRVTAAPSYDRALTFEENVRRAAASFYLFCRSPDRGGGAFVIEIPDARYGRHKASLANAVDLTLHQLSNYDPSAYQSMRSGIGQPGWMFKFARVTLSLAVFAPCLAPADPGDTFGLASSFFLFRLALPPSAEASVIKLPVWHGEGHPVPTPFRFASVAAASSRADIAA